jgi:hypothetical protein
VHAPHHLVTVNWEDGGAWCTLTDPKAGVGTLFQSPQFLSSVVKQVGIGRDPLGEVGRVVQDSGVLGGGGGGALIFLG